MSFIISQFSGDQKCRYKKGIQTTDHPSHWWVKRYGEMESRSACSQHLVRLIREWGESARSANRPSERDGNNIITKELQVTVPTGGWELTRFKAEIVHEEGKWSYKERQKTITYQRLANVRSIGHVKVMGSVWMEPNYDSKWRGHLILRGEVFKKEQDLNAGQGECPTQEQAMVMCKALVDYLATVSGDHPFEEQIRIAAGLNPVYGR